MAAPEPGRPLDVMFTPDTSPCIDCTTPDAVRSWRDCSLTVETEPNKSFFLTVPYPITTDSSRMVLSCLRTTFICGLAISSVEVKPKLLNVRTAVCGTSMEKLPSASVRVLTVLPFSWVKTATPARGSPDSSLTHPFVLSCADKDTEMSKEMMMTDSFLFIFCQNLV